MPDRHLIETNRQTLQAQLDSRRSDRQRNRLGQFATPNALAVQIAECVAKLMEKDRGDIHFGEPSVGLGSFFSAALNVFGRQRIVSATGIELDPEFSAAAGELWAKSGLTVVQGDFTRVVARRDRPAAPNLILANPPYVRHHHLSRQEKQRLQNLTRTLTGVEVNGLAGLYVYFLLLATEWMADGGYAAWLVPSEFMDVNYGAAIKTFLVHEVTLNRIHRFDPDEVQFGDALVSSAILFFRKQPPPGDHRVEFSFGGTMGNPQATDFISLKDLGESRKWTVYPRHAKNDRRSSTDGNAPTLGSLFRIQRGIATGGNKFFVLDRADAERRGFPPQHLRPILPGPRNLKQTVVEREHDGYPGLKPQLCVIDCDLPERLIGSKYPALHQYLQTADALGVRDGYLVGKRSPWYRQERREPSPFLCTYMGRGSQEKQPFRFIWNKSDAIGTNLYLMLYPRRALASMLKCFPEREARLFELLGRITGHELRGEGRVYGGGLHKIEPSELGRISAVAIVNMWPELNDAVVRAEDARLFA